MKAFAFLVAILAVATAGTAHAQERRITVTGTGSVEAAPDMATLTLGVTNRDAQAAVSMQATSEAVAKILARLQQLGVEARDIQTRDLSLSPVWNGRRPQQDDAPEIEGFVASNRVFVRLRELDRLGEVLDAALRDGANHFGGLSFAVQDPEPLTAAARHKSVT